VLDLVPGPGRPIAAKRSGRDPPVRRLGREAQDDVRAVERSGLHRTGDRFEAAAPPMSARVALPGLGHVEQPRRRRAGHSPAAPAELDACAPVRHCDAQWFLGHQRLLTPSS